MSAKPETTFYTSVHKHLPSIDLLHHEKMSNPYRAGTFDHWYSGGKADLWVEWKFIVLPKRDTTLIDICGGKKPSLSALQQQWGYRRHHEGRDVWVIIGCKEGGVICRMPPEWTQTFRADGFRACMLTRPQIAEAIAQHCR